MPSVVEQGFERLVGKPIVGDSGGGTPYAVGDAPEVVESPQSPNRPGPPNRPTCPWDYSVDKNALPGKPKPKTKKVAKKKKKGRSTCPWDQL